MAPGRLAGRPWPIVANNQLAGLVVVPPQPPFTFLLMRYAPPLLSVASVTLVVGSVIAAFVIFGPTRRRLKALEDAARRLGSGDLAMDHAERRHCYLHPSRAASAAPSLPR